MDSAKKTSKDSRPPVATNRKALRDYFVVQRIEAGIVLRGAEVKSIREGRFSLNEAFSRIDKGQAVLCGFHIQPYEHARADGYDPVRPKRLLLHRREIDKLVGETATKGMALVPLKLYFHRGHVKVELGLCRGKHAGDKRETIRRRTAEREAERAIASRTRHKA
jgi:SsrA-binding protein